MPARVLYLGLLMALLAPAAGAQEWARAVFNKLDHDFETVARGADTVFRFEATNQYQEDIRLVSVRSSCGCTTPSIESTGWIPTWGKGYVVARFNTRTFTGIHSATLTVDLEVKGKTPVTVMENGVQRVVQRDNIFRGQVQLRVHGNIRGDVVFEPGAITFGEVTQGEPVEKRVTVTYSGRPGWRIQDIRSVSDNLEVELTERMRNGGRAAYDLLARMKEGAAPGMLREQLVIVTNDAANPRVPIDVEARVIPEISIVPGALVFGSVPKGETVTKRILVKGKKPFRILSIECKDECLTFSAPDRPASRHLVQVTFEAKENPGERKAPITIRTDRGDSFTASCTALATIDAGEPEAEVAQAPADTNAGATPTPGDLVSE